PMDGGRVLRGLLGLRMSRVAATEAAVTVGRVLAIGMAATGLFVNPWLILIALFVWIVVGLELRQVQALEAYRRMRHEGLGDLPPNVLAMLRLFDIDPRAVAVTGRPQAQAHAHAESGTHTPGSEGAPHGPRPRPRPRHAGWPFGGIP